MKDFMIAAKALSDQNRIRILMALKGRELCVCQLIRLLGLAPSTVSKHILILRYAGFLDGRKSGTWMHYRIAPKMNRSSKTGLDWVFSALSRDGKIREDQKKLKKF
jgi:DNA-binding transcriptional ArsR family regulator